MNENPSFLGIGPGFQRELWSLFSLPLRAHQYAYVVGPRVSETSLFDGVASQSLGLNHVKLKNPPSTGGLTGHSIRRQWNKSHARSAQQPPAWPERLGEARCYHPRMVVPCIFCENESGSEEHLWAAWIHRLIKFGPIRVQEGTGPETISDDPERTINTVCHQCNNNWMSRLEDKNKPSLCPMIQNEPITIDPGRQRLLTEWAVKTAMVQDSIKPRLGNENFYTREERLNMRLSRRIPDNTHIWLALSRNHIWGHLARTLPFWAATEKRGSVLAFRTRSSSAILSFR